MNNKVFEESSVPKAVFSLALPAIATSLVTMIYNLADTFFVGQTGDSNQVAAVSLVLPIFFLFMSFGNIFGMGGSSVISRLLGEGNSDKVKKVSSFCFYTSIAASLVLTFGILVFMPNLLTLLGCSENTAGFTENYLKYLAYGGVFIIISNAFSNIVRSEGAAKTAMIGMMIGTILNIVLDPIMIFTLNMGVAGAAIATVIGNACSVAYYLIFLIGKKTGLSISLRDFSAKDGIAKGVFAVGLPAAAANILMSASMVVLNTFLSAFDDVAIAAMGVAMKATSILTFMQMGLGIGVMPLIGYNFGAKQYDKMKKVLLFTIECTVAIGIVLGIVFFIFTKQIISVFIDDAAVIDYGVKILHALTLSAPVLGIPFTLYGAFQAMGKSISALLIIISRQGLVFIPALFLGNMIAGFNGIIYAQPIADGALVVMSVIMFVAIYKKWSGEISAGNLLKAETVE
jgi:putative MATE family efflux protein